MLNCCNNHGRRDAFDCSVHWMTANEKSEIVRADVSTNNRPVEKAENYTNAQSRYLILT